MELREGSYFIQNVKALDIAEQFGTPVYVYDANKILHQLNTLKTAFADVDVKIKYAVKALSNLSILRLLKKNGSGADVVSIQEAHLALKAGFLPSEIMFSPNCADFSEIEEAVKLGLVINIDNLPFLKKFGAKYGSSYPCSIRLNPHIMAGGNIKISTGHSDSKFGISVHQLAQILDVVKQYTIKIEGLHIHTGSDITETDVFLKMADIFFSVAHSFSDLKFIDFGSGFKVSYKEGDKVMDVADLGVKLTERFNIFCKQYGRNLELWFEPGKFIVSESGHLLAKTTLIKSTPSTTFVGVNTGLNHLLRPMMYDAYHHILNISNPTGEQHVYTVVGYICETDTIGAGRKLNEVSEGDILAIKNAGAYGFSMASNYNSRLRPAEVLVINDEAKLIRERENFEDLLKGQVEIDL
ncbi:MAG: diaminopimelate decarboxylase [Cyclobacteriaceae bacterium]|nr:diaminopimelate decarboxylase [Cyclobacteriaceae bacterium]